MAGGEAGGVAAGAGGGNSFYAEHPKEADDHELEISVVNASGREIHREYVHRR